MSPSRVRYSYDDRITPEQFIGVLRRSGLGPRRPVDDPPRIERMLRGADVLVTAWCDQRLIGVSRAVSDFAYCTYLSDLAVDAEHQRGGIGRELIRRTHQEAGLETALVLLAAPAAEGYYPHLGMQRHDACWFIPRAKVAAGGVSGV